VTYVALQLAFHLGFQEVIMVGVDHSFSTQGAPNTLVTSTSQDLLRTGRPLGVARP
jgi:hypothetical protein